MAATGYTGSHALMMNCALQLVFLCCIYALQDEVVSNNRQRALTDKEFGDLVVKTYGRRRRLENITLEDGGQVKVTDIMIPFNPYKKLVVNRVAEIREGFHSSVRLKLPEKLTASTIDTSQWEIDKTFLFPHTYYIRMIVAMFRSNLINLSQDSNARILEIGLGGGTIDGFLHEVFPQMDITVVEISRKTVNMARKWFGMVEDDHHKVVVADGVAYIAAEARTGTQYDAILIDACRSEHPGNINCPLEIFYSHQVLRDIAKLLPPQGILVINVLSLRLDVDSAYRILANKLLVYFAYCDKLRWTGSRNQVIYCLHRAPTPKPMIDMYKFLSDIKKM